MPRNRRVLFTWVGAGALLALGLLMKTAGSLSEILTHPIQAFLGSQKQLNSTLLEVSESTEPVRAAGRRLLQPFGAIRLVRIYDTRDSEPSQKKQK